MAWFLVDSKKDEVVVFTGQPIRVRIVRSEAVVSNHLGGDSTRPRKAGVQDSGRQGPAPAKLAHETAKMGRSKAPAAVQSYADLFPQNQNEAFESSGEVGNESAEHGTGSYDPESDQFSFDDNARNMAQLNGFARELSERISVPNALKVLEPSGRAFLRFSRKKDGWRIIAVDGDCDLPRYSAPNFLV